MIDNPYGENPFKGTFEFEGKTYTMEEFRENMKGRDIGGFVSTVRLLSFMYSSVGELNPEIAKLYVNTYRDVYEEVGPTTYLSRKDLERMEVQGPDYDDIYLLNDEIFEATPETIRERIRSEISQRDRMYGLYIKYMEDVGDSRIEKFIDELSEIDPSLKTERIEYKDEGWGTETVSYSEFLRSKLDENIRIGLRRLVYTGRTSEEWFNSNTFDISLTTVLETFKEIWKDREPIQSKQKKVRKDSESYKITPYQPETEVEMSYISRVVVGRIGKIDNLPYANDKKQDVTIELDEGGKVIKGYEKVLQRRIASYYIWSGKDPDEKVVIPMSTLYTMMTGKRSKPHKEWINSILTYLDNCSKVRVSINTKEQLSKEKGFKISKENEKYAPKLRNKPMKGSYISSTIDYVQIGGNDVYSVIVLEMPIVYRHSKVIGQNENVPLDFYYPTDRRTSEDIVTIHDFVGDYILTKCRVQKKGQKVNALTYEAIYGFVDKDLNPKGTQSERNRATRIRNETKHYLDELKEKGYIESWSEYPKNGNKLGIEVVVNGPPILRLGDPSSDKNLLIGPVKGYAK